MFTAVGEVLAALIPAPVPASIYGMALLFICLLTGIVKLEQVKSVGDILISLMPLMFIGPAVRVMVAFSGHESFILPFIVITVVSLYLVMIVTGLIAQRLRRGKGKEDE